MTDESELATEALGRKPITFFKTEAALLVRSRHIPQRSLGYIAYQVFLIDKMVTWIDITVVLDDGIAAACGSVCA